MLYMKFVIEEDHIFSPDFDDKSAVGRTFRTSHDDQIDLTRWERFEVYDDDLNLYFAGTIYGEYDGFEPLDSFGRAYGATRIKLNGEWL